MWLEFHFFERFRRLGTRWNGVVFPKLFTILSRIGLNRVLQYSESDIAKLSIKRRSSAKPLLPRTYYSTTIDKQSDPFWSVLRLPNNNDSPSSKLSEYLNTKLLGSSMTVVRVSDTQIQAKAGDNIILTILLDTSKKTLSFNLFSPTINRDVTFEDVQGIELLDVRLDDELKSSNHEAEQEDTIIAIDLLRMWAKENKYTVIHIPRIEKIQ